MTQGILLAGGNGTRLLPLTKILNKHFLPIHDKPLIFYSLTTMILAGVRDLIVICREQDKLLYECLLKDGSEFGIQIRYRVQREPEGIPQALLLASNDLDENERVFLGLGDNLIYGPGSGRHFSYQNLDDKAKIFCFSVSNPTEFGVAELDRSGSILSLEEKPLIPRSNLAITGFYSLPSDSFEIAKTLRKSVRGEYEIIDLLKIYLDMNRLDYGIFPRGTSWLDAGTTEGMTSSAEFVRLVQNRQGILVCSPHEAAWQVGNIDSSELANIAQEYGKSKYGEMLANLTSAK